MFGINGQRTIDIPNLFGTVLAKENLLIIFFMKFHNNFASNGQNHKGRSKMLARDPLRTFISMGGGDERGKVA